MTPLPKRKLSTRRQSQRRRAKVLSAGKLISCPNCHRLTYPHRVCRHCGFYGGHQIVKTK